MAIETAMEARREEVMMEESEYMKGVKRLCEIGITSVPSRYILPVPDRPKLSGACGDCPASPPAIKMPVIDLSLLRTAERPVALESLAVACSQYGFFQVVNHGIPGELVRGVMEVAKRFFELPFEERARFMSADIRTPVRYGTSFNQVNDGVFFWRDFLKLSCQPLAAVLPCWPSSPPDLRERVVGYAREAKMLFMELMEAILETLGVGGSGGGAGGMLKELGQGTHMMVVNCYPACPEPGLTLGMPPHSDYGFLTLLQQDGVEGLQVQHAGEWVTVDPLPGSLVVNLGDHLQIYSNGKYKSVLHRVLVNSARTRTSVASLLSLPAASVVSPAAELIDEANPRRYKDTDFAAFLDYISSREAKGKDFLESRKLVT